MIAMIISVTIATIAFISAPEIFQRARDGVLDEHIQAINRSTEQYISFGGEFDPAITPQDALLLVQTPVDAMSRRAGFGRHELVDHRLELQDAPERGARAVFRYDPLLKRPVWTVETEGEGFLIVQNPERQIPSTADWTERVNRAGQKQARKSNWVWDYDENTRYTSNGPGKSVTDSGKGGGYGGTATESSLWIDGSLRITSPGAYYWTGNSTQGGRLTLSISKLNDTKTSSSATQVISGTHEFSPGTAMSFIVTLKLERGGSLPPLVVSNAVDVDIPATPDLIIEGPDKVSELGTVEWEAISSVVASPITIKIEDGTETKSYDAKNVKTPPTAFPPGTKKTIKIIATALNASGMSRAEKDVELDVIAPPEADWILPNELSSGQIDYRGVYTFLFKTTAGGPGKLNASILPMAAPLYEHSGGNLPEEVTNSAPNAMELPVTIDVSAVPASVRYSGTIRLVGTFQNPVDTITVVRDVPIDIRRTERLFKWEMKIYDLKNQTQPSDILSFTVQIKRNGVLYKEVTAEGNRFLFEQEFLLPVGSYEIEGWAIDRRFEEPINTEEGILKLNVNDD